MSGLAWFTVSWRTESINIELENVIEHMLKHKFSHFFMFFVHILYRCLSSVRVNKKHKAFFDLQAINEIPKTLLLLLVVVVIYFTLTTNIQNVAHYKLINKLINI